MNGGKAIGLLLFFLLLLGCRESDYPGYSRLKKSVHYKLLALGDEDRPVASGAYISLRIELKSGGDSTAAIKNFSRIQRKGLSLPGPLQDLLLQSHLLDSVAVIGTAGDLGLSQLFTPVMFPHDTALVHLTMTVLEVLDDAEFRAYRANERLLLDLEMAEQQALNKIRDSLKLKESNYRDGMYYLPVKEGRGPKPESGAMAVVHYKARFHDGTLFDNTYNAEPLEYEIGRPDQVIDGFATGIAQMREGGEAIFVIPSQLGFGSRGSSSGIVPPFTTLIYEVKLVRAGI